jgi:hypothetical protein
MLPPQGFRHAVDLLLKNRARRPHGDADQLARELVALGKDMKAPPEFAAWIIEEYERVFHQPAPALLRELGGTPAREPEHRELFLIYVPEDRLPIAAPLAVELAKRRVSVAFAEYEVDSATQLTTALARGRRIHRAGAVLVTPAFLHRGLCQPVPDDRLAILGHMISPPAQAEDLILWLSKSKND